MSSKTLWDIAIEQYKEKESKNKETKESVLLLLGSKRGGKSTICYKFLERSETPKSTLALEYTFGRRNKSIDSGKEICHIWELGGGTVFTDLLQIPITPKTILSLSVILVLDLSAPEELWYTMETLLNAVHKQIQSVLSSVNDPTIKQHLYEQAKNRIPPNHEDIDKIEPFLVPLLIIGTKYDLFQNIDFEKKKIICKCLRFIAHSKAANLQFSTFKSESSVSKIRASLSSLVFGTSCSKTCVMDHNKSLYICAGADSFQSIGSISTLNMDNNIGPKSLETVKQIFASYFPPAENKSNIHEDPAADPHFREPDIDMLREQKAQELKEYKRHKNERNINWD